MQSDSEFRFRVVAVNEDAIELKAFSVSKAVELSVELERATEDHDSATRERDAAMDEWLERTGRNKAGRN